jgi:hypothetical protein
MMRSALKRSVELKSSARSAGASACSARSRARRTADSRVTAEAQAVFFDEGAPLLVGSGPRAELLPCERDWHARVLGEAGVSDEIERAAAGDGEAMVALAGRLEARARAGGRGARMDPPQRVGRLARRVVRLGADPCGGRRV